MGKRGSWKISDRICWSKSKKSQVWVETVVYTLIGLTMIGIVLGVATPKIKQMTDNALIEQTMTALNELDDKIYSTQTAAGNSREMYLSIKKGSFVIDGVENQIYFILEGTGLKFSEPGTEIKQGNIIILTEEQNKKYNIKLTLDYSMDITYNGKNEIKTLTQAPTAYHLLIENKGGGKLDVRTV